MRALSSWVLLASSVALAKPAPRPVAPPPPIDVAGADVDLSLFTDPLPWSSEEPGGLVIPASAAKGWAVLGLRPGDILVREDGRPIQRPPTLVEGPLELDVLRDGKLLEMRYVIHGDATRKIAVSDGVIHDLVHTTDPIGTEATVHGKPTGVRIISALIWFDLGVGDIVRSIDGNPVTTNAQLVAGLTSLKVGQTELVLEREGGRLSYTLEREQPVDVTTIARVDATHFKVPMAVLKAVGHDADLVTRGAQFKSDAGKLVVTAVDAGSLLERAGFVAGDEITDIIDKPVAAYDGDLSLELFGAWMHIHRKTPAFDIKIKRKNAALTLSYAIDPP